jgi:hypothetical protein
VSEQQPMPEPRSQSTLLTGDVQVDRAVALLDDLDNRPVDEHVAVLEQVHACLREALSRPADAPAEPPAPSTS